MGPGGSVGKGPAGSGGATDAARQAGDPGRPGGRQAEPKAQAGEGEGGGGAGNSKRRRKNKKKKGQAAVDAGQREGGAAAKAPQAGGGGARLGKATLKLVHRLSVEQRQLQATVNTAYLIPVAHPLAQALTQVKQGYREALPPMGSGAKGNRAAHPWGAERFCLLPVLVRYAYEFLATTAWAQQDYHDVGAALTGVVETLLPSLFQDRRRSARLARYLTAKLARSGEVMILVVGPGKGRLVPPMVNHPIHGMRIMDLFQEAVEEYECTEAAPPGPLEREVAAALRVAGEEAAETFDMAAEDSAMGAE